MRDVDVFRDQLYQYLQKQQHEIMIALAVGSAANIEEYRHRVGEYTAYSNALQALKVIFERVMRGPVDE